jgi:tetratricopeptide (TPR) repeat protein
LSHRKTRSKTIVLARAKEPFAGATALARILLALAFIFALLMAVPARAENAKVQASEQDGYGRLVVTFDDPPSATAKIANGIVIVSFTKPADFSVEHIQPALSSYVSSVRRDPDGTGIRLALSRSVKINAIQAGEKFFLDIMPANWKGMPPALPADVIADLTQRALDAERVKKELARAQTLPPVTMRVSAGSNDQRIRVTFSFSDKIEMRFKNEGRRGVLTVPGTTLFDIAEARAELPPEITDFSATQVSDALVVRFSGPDGMELRGSQEENSFAIDFAPHGSFEPKATIAPEEPAATEPKPEHSAAEPEEKWDEIAEIGGAIEDSEGDYALDVMSDQPVQAETPKPDAAPAKTAEAAAPAAPAPAEKPAAAEPATKAEAHAAATPEATTPEPSTQAQRQGRPQSAPKVIDAAQAPKLASAASLPAAAPAAAAPKNLGESHPKPPAEDPAHVEAAKTAEGPVPTEASDTPEPDAPILSKAEQELKDFADSAARYGVQLKSSEGTLKIAIPFETLPPAAAFIRGSSAFVVFDGNPDIDVAKIADQSKGLISAVRKSKTASGSALEMSLTQPRLASLVSSGRTWVLSLSDTILEPTRPMQLAPTFTPDGRTALHIKAEGTGLVHRVPDAQIGDELLVVTLKPPARGLVRERDFIEFGALATAQGLAFEPFADDLEVKAGDTEIVLTRSKGLTLSLDAEPAVLALPVQLKPGSPFAAENWHKAQTASPEAISDLARAAAAAPPEARSKARLQLARLELAGGNAAETKGILDVATAESATLADDPEVKILRGTALVMLRRFDEAAKMLGSGTLTNNGEAALWRMIAEAGLGHVGLAREAFRDGEPVLDAMPPDLQRIFRQTMVEVAVAAQDFAAAATQLDALDALGVTENWAGREIMRGRVAEGFGQPALALEAYRRAMESANEEARAQGRLHAVNLRYKMQEIQRAEAIKNLEMLTTDWRGDSTEAEALASLTELYRADERWRDAFTTMRTAMTYHADAASTRRMQDQMTAEFAKLFLGQGADAAPPTLESVALFYDFKELTPPGKKGDILIRNLADRLVEVDLLTQAADLLTYQVKNRLQGAPRAQVAAHAAAIELMDRKPGRALNMLHDTRISGLPSDVVRSRLILEARALSELQRPDLALEMIAGYSGDDVDRLRADIQWAAQRWQSAAEALEVMLGSDWSDSEPLDDDGRKDVLRAAIAYALAEDDLGLDRLRQKYAAKLSNTPDQATFDIVTSPAETRGADFVTIAKSVAVSDTLKAFLDDYRKRYPESAPPPVRAEQPADKTADAKTQAPI